MIEQTKTFLDANMKGNARKVVKDRQKWNDRDEQAFGNPIDQSMEQDFDFEKNLALFNKKVWYLSIYNFCCLNVCLS